MSVINLDDFFEFGNQAPINRIAYTKEDAKFKLKCIKAMQDLGMEISIDYAGNICGTLKGDIANGRTFVMGSHTDSVFDGGQFDGPVGVYMALKTVEQIKESKQKRFGNLKVVIHSCEESSRFSKACIGSQYLSGKLSLEQLANLKDRNGKEFLDVLKEYKDALFQRKKNKSENPETEEEQDENGIDLENIKIVDRVVSPHEALMAIESHIEQSEILSDSNIEIGIVDSISKPLRGTISIEGEDSIVTSAKVIIELNALAKESKSEGKEEDLRITIPQFDSSRAGTAEDTKTVKSDNGNLFVIKAKGKTSHSGATPMDQRQDAVLGLAKLIVKLQQMQTQNPDMHFEFLGSSTEKWGANQIQDDANLVLKIEPAEISEKVRAELGAIEEQEGVTFEIQPQEEVRVSKNPYTKLFVDVRQQYPVTAKETKKRINNIFSKIKGSRKSQNKDIVFDITDEGDPIQTSPELIKKLKEFCEKMGISYKVMHSWPGHDIANYPPQEEKPDPNAKVEMRTSKRMLFFVPSTGQSHNPMESTTREAIERGTALYSAFISNQLSRAGIFGIPHNLDIKSVLKRKVEFAQDCQYLIQKKLGLTTEIDAEVKERIKEEKDENGEKSEYDRALLCFEKNFLKTIGKNPFDTNMEEHKEDALKYLEGAFPFCFGINLRDQKATGSNKSFNLDLAFYAMCLGATEEQVGSIRSLLKSKKVSTKCRDNKLEMLSNGTMQSNNGKEFAIYTTLKKKCCIDDIQASSVEAYQGENLYEVLRAVNDKGIGGYMENIMKSGGLNNSGKVFEEVCLHQDSEGNLFVSMGNHRVFAYQALKAVKEFVTGQEEKGISFDATLYPVTIREMDVEL